MAIPADAPSTPACQDPDVSTLPPSYSLVSSPKYQTLPDRSCAYQSSVSSSSVPSSLTTSCTTVVVTPPTTRVLGVTVTTVRSVPSAVWPVNRHTVPTRHGIHGLSITRTKLPGDGAVGTAALTVARGEPVGPPAEGVPPVQPVAAPASSSGSARARRRCEEVVMG